VVDMTNADKKDAKGGGDAKAKFREALERKRSHQADRAADSEAQAASKIHGEHGAAGNNRMFRRKSGG
jgi:cellobiose-specific phosphotransferase system component IIA